MARREYPGAYPYPAAGGRTLYRTLYTDSNGRQRQNLDEWVRTNRLPFNMVNGVLTVAFWDGKTPRVRGFPSGLCDMLAG